MIATRLQNFFISWMNDYLTLSRFAKDHDLTEDEAKRLLTLAKEVHERKVQEYKEIINV